MQYTIIILGFLVALTLAGTGYSAKDPSDSQIWALIVGHSIKSICAAIVMMGSVYIAVTLVK